MGVDAFLLCSMFVQSLLLDTGMSRGYEMRLLESMPARVSVCEQVAHSANARGIEWELMVSLSFEESRYSSNAKSWAGAVGPMQVLPKYHCPGKKSEGCDLIKAGLDAWEKFSARVSKKDPLRTETILCHYNAGNKCTKSGRRYARRILDRLWRMKRRAEYIKRQVSMSLCIDNRTGDLVSRAFGGCLDLKPLRSVQ